MPKITITDNAGNPQGDSFDSNTEESIGIQAQEQGYGVPFSCGIGACRTCVGKVTRGQEHINKEGVSPCHIDIEDDEILTCTASVKPEAPDDAEIEVRIENL